MEAVPYPAAHMTNEGDVSEWSCGRGGVQEVRHAGAAETGRQVSRVCAVCGNRTEAVVALG